MTPALANIFLAALAACNAHATRFRADVSPIQIGLGVVSAGTAWEPGFESCATNGPRMAALLKTYFITLNKQKHARELRDDEVAVMRAAVALGQMQTGK